MVVLTVTFIGFAAAAAAAAPAAPGAALALVEVLVLTNVVIPSAACEVVLVPVVDVTMVLWMRLTEVPVLLTVVVSKTTCMMAVLLTLVHCHMPEASEKLGGGVEVAGKGSPYGVGVGPKAEK